ncbi:SusC/RagA family TonB-linked outer membrane protein [uncultured Muribaculum sp.]|uniref:SusC/RagA family TonB-linked outer membrane protein n=1 Tax=uncultured Muribaculum sp. TaxID=1918613 RepID=UPI002607FE50|nr:SusC/RagA family TonB-linked outer membrane protein [uncultured Muribaculum sp.]
MAKTMNQSSLRTVFLGVTAAIALSASAQISLTTTSATPVSEVIKKIKSQGDYEFFYDSAIAKSHVKAATLKDATIDKTLATLLDGSDIKYTIKDKFIYLSLKGKKASGVSKKITGQVLDELGEPMIGATVRIKGTNIAAVTDIDGNYTISTTEPDPVVSIAYVDYKTADVAADGKESVNVTLDPSSAQLDEVVVTAFGIKREKKMLGYSVQEVKGDALNPTGDPSVIGALDGKVAGLQMNTASTGLGGSTKITIRGNSSLTDNNQPLWIVDGVPFTDNQSSDASAYGGYDRGGTSFDINPEDIESISVLKGPNAAALYGARAGNGVILVTTKRGTAGKGIGLSYSTSMTWSKVADNLKFQKVYGQGSQGQFIFAEDADGNPTYLDGSEAWGPAFDGSMQLAKNGLMIPYAYHGDKLKDYFKTGFSQFHTVALSNSNDKSNYRLSLGFNDNDGMFKGESLRKLNIDFSAGHTFTDWLKSEGKVSVSNTKAKNRPMTGVNGEVGQLLMIPGNIRLSDIEEYETAERAHYNWFGPNQFYSNPYYVRSRFRNSDERWRAFGFYGLNLNLGSWIHFNAKYAFDYYRTRIEESDFGINDSAVSTDDLGWQSKVIEDKMKRAEENHFEQNISAVFMGDKRLGDNFRVGFTVGGNYMYQKYEYFSATVSDMLQKNNWIFNTGANLYSAVDKGHKRAMYSVYGSGQIAFREYLSLDLTARNDWSSTLPKDHCSFFYPSASLSYVLSDFMRDINHSLPEWITFTKVRVSAARVGKDPEPYNLYNTKQFEFVAGKRQDKPQTIKMNSELKPEIKTSYEAGLDAKFFDNRLGIDFTYYYNSTKNQSMLVDTSSPWSQMWVNAGRITNRGIEFMIYGTPIQTKDFTFDLTVNIAHNESRVDELADGVDRIYFAGDDLMPVKVGAKSGGKLGDIYAKQLIKRDAQGRVVVGSNGLPQPANGDGNLEKYLLDHPIGNIQPDLTMSVTPSFRWKGFSLSALFDMKFGGDVVCMSEGIATRVGTSERTIDRGEFKEINGKKDYYMVVPGVKEDGSVNDIPVSAQSYYSTIGLNTSPTGYAEEFVHDASYIKLKELSFGYTFPSKWLCKTPFTNLRASFVARNLCFLMKHTPGNPDGGYDTSMFSQALDFLAVPYARTYGFTFNVEF